MKNLPLSAIKEHNIEFVILGTDDMAYSLAHIIHRNYGAVSTLIGSGINSGTSNSRILKREIYKQLREDDKFVELLKNYKKNCEKKNLILFPIADIYTMLLAKHADELKDDFYFIVPTKKNIDEMLKKEDFYAQLEKHNIPYPKTLVCDDSIDVNDVKLMFPVVLKFDNSAMYMANSLHELSKVYFIYSKEELAKILNDVKKSKYTDKIILQEFIPGEPSKTYSLNAFSDSEGKVRMMALGRVFAYDIDPSRIGNNWAIKTLGNMEVFKEFERFLNNTGYKGFSNFDLKFDPRDNLFKPLEINIRFPASMGFLDAGGVNFVDFYIRDLMKIPYNEEVYYHETNEKIWLDAHPKAILATMEEEFKEEFKQSLKKGYYYSQYYENDKSLRRWLRHKKRLRKTLDDVKKYDRLPE